MTYVEYTIENDATGETCSVRYNGRYEDASEAGLFDAKPGETITQITDSTDPTIGQRISRWLRGLTQ